MGGNEKEADALIVGACGALWVVLQCHHNVEGNCERFDMSPRDPLRSHALMPPNGWLQ